MNQSINHHLSEFSPIHNQGDLVCRVCCSVIGWFSIGVFGSAPPSRELRRRGQHDAADRRVGPGRGGLSGARLLPGQQEGGQTEEEEEEEGNDGGHELRSGLVSPVLNSQSI